MLDFHKSSCHVLKLIYVDNSNYTCINHHTPILSVCKPYVDRREVKKYIIKQILLFIQKNLKFYLILVLVT